MKPYRHARNSVKRYGGEPGDYMPIHEFMDSSKSVVADMRHRCVLHSAFGVYIVERVFGQHITNSSGRRVHVRDVAEEHVMEDMGRIPSLQDYLSGMPMYEWLGGLPKRKSFFPFTKDEDT